VVVDPEILLEEIDKLAQMGISLNDRLLISENAHLVLDYHKTEDRLREESLGKSKIGTTIRGIGPCYADKVGRSYAVRILDLQNLDELQARLEAIVNYKNKIFTSVYNAALLNAGCIIEKCRQFADRLLPYMTNTTEFLHKSIKDGKSILFEGAQGSLLDLDHGTYPYVTSSNASSLGMPAGCGVPAKLVDKFIGVVKAYTTRVGSGPFPSEQENETGQYIRDRGHEYGTTTGRPRRCGWFDAVAVSYSAAISSIDIIALMHLDTLSGLKEVKVCRAYQIDGEEVTFFPTDSARLARAVCIYETFPGWEELKDVKDFNGLPSNAQNYIRQIERLTHKTITIIGVGPRRSQTIFR
jgi:adenylosuccinate synthase